MKLILLINVFLCSACIVPFSPNSKERRILVNENDSGLNHGSLYIEDVLFREEEDGLNVVVKVPGFKTAELSKYLLCVVVVEEFLILIDECLSVDSGAGSEGDLQVKVSGKFANSTQNSIAVICSLQSRATGMFITSDAFYIMKKYSKSTNVVESGVSFIIFSKDRPFEVEALVYSIKRFVVGDFAIFLVFSTSCDAAKKRYKNISKNVIALEQDSNTFHQAFLEALDRVTTTYVVPLVGENMFFRNINFAAESIKINQWFLNHKFSSYQLRLGKNLEVYNHLNEATSFVSFTPTENEGFVRYRSDTAQQNFCLHGQQNLNDFWWSHNLGGAIYLTQYLKMMFTQNGFALSKYNIKHPGDMETIFSTLGRKYSDKWHLIPNQSYVFSNNFASEVRPDHLETRITEGNLKKSCSRLENLSKEKTDKMLSKLAINENHLTSIRYSENILQDPKAS
eukprot:snap_masked-scaffold_8-processed-gene-4.11-mRNA-1 protein AED:1.00 eAED:1.00 QI:0/-1/0/0/-1/1/1/0/452